MKLFSRLNHNFQALLLASAAILVGSCAPDVHAQPVQPYATGSITTQNLVPAGAATAGSAVELFTQKATVLVIQVTGTWTGALSVQVTNDGVNWITLAGATAINNVATATGAATIPSGTNGVYSASIPGNTKTRVTGLAAMTGTAVVTLRN